MAHRQKGIAHRQKHTQKIQRKSTTIERLGRKIMDIWELGKTLQGCEIIKEY